MAKSLFRLFPIITIFFGCLFDGDDGPKVPPLNEEELRGCWITLNPSPMNCIEGCYLDSNVYYTIVRSEEGLNIQDVGEWLGIYTIIPPNRMDVVYRSKTDFFSEDLGEFRNLEYFLTEDTLYNITGGGTKCLRQV